MMKDNKPWGIQMGINNLSYFTRHDYVDFTGHIPLKVYARKVTDEYNTIYTIQPIAPKSKLIRWLQAHLSFFNKLVVFLLTLKIEHDQNCKIIEGCLLHPKRSAIENLDNINQCIHNDTSDFFKNFKGSVDIEFPHKHYNFSSDDSGYSISIHLPFVKRQPEMVLQSFYNGCYAIDNDITTLKIKTLDEHLKRVQTVDMGGPKRQFITELFESLVEKATQNQTSILTFEPTVAGCLPKISGDILGEQEGQLYKAIGKIMQICQNSNGSITLGQIFDPAIYDVIAAITPDMLHHEIEELSDESIFTLYRALKNREDDKLFELYDLQNAKAEEKTLRMMLDYAYPDGEESRPKFLRNNPNSRIIQKHFLQIKEQIKNNIIDNARTDPYLPPILKMGQVIAKNNLWYMGLPSQQITGWSQAKADSILEEIQGKFSRSDVKTAISCYNHSIKQYFNRWVNETSEENIRTFLKVATGSNTIGPRTVITINLSSMDVKMLPSYHTCGREMDIPEYGTYEIFKRKLEQSFDSLSGVGFHFT